MNTQQNNPQFNSPIQWRKFIWVFVVFLIITALVVGGWWQKSSFEKERIKELEGQITQLPEIKEEEVENDPYESWKIYRNEEYGFEIKYPQESEGPQESNDYIWLIHGDVYIMIHEATEDSLTNWIKKNETCGGPRDTNNYLDMNKISLKNYTLAGSLALRIKNLGPCPPGASSARDVIYSEYNNKIYQIKCIDLAGNEWWRSKTEEEKEAIFDQMLSTFKFTD